MRQQHQDKHHDDSIITSGFDFRQGIARKLIFYILCFSSVITLMATGIQLYFDYSKDVQAIDEQMRQIETTYLKSITNALWNYDAELLKVQFEGILHLPDMQYLEIKENFDDSVFSAGILKTRNIIRHEYPMYYHDKKRNEIISIGTLYASATLEKVYQRLIDKTMIILITQAVKTFLVSTFIFFIFYFLVGRHLRAMAIHSKSLDADRLDSPFVLNRKTRDNHRDNHKDELDQLVLSFNEMCTSLKDSYTQLRMTNEQLHMEILEREKAEEKIRKSERQLQAILDNSPAVIYLKDTQGRFMLVNRQFEKVFHMSQETIIGKTDYDFMPEEVADIYRQNDLKILESGIPIQFEESADLKDGTHTVVSVKFPMLTNDGTPCGVCGISTDITKRKKMEEELRHLRNFLSNIVNSMPSVLIGVDMEGNITHWNREAERITSIPAARMQGAALADVFPQLAKDAENIRENQFRRLEKVLMSEIFDSQLPIFDLKNSRDSDNQKSEETGLFGKTRFLAIQKPQIRNQEKPGFLEKPGFSQFKNLKSQYADITFYPLIDNGIRGVIIRMDDVTERVRFEEMMIQTEKMMSVGGLAAGMAHEINNPLGGILQSIQNILRRVSPELPVNEKIAEECGTNLETIRAYLETRSIIKYLHGVQDAGKRAAEIVRNMLQFSRRSESRTAPVNLSQLLDKTIELASHDYDLKKKYDFRNIEIIREYEPDMPLVPCSESEIEQVILNLLRNAAQAIFDFRLPIAESEETGFLGKTRFLENQKSEEETGFLGKTRFLENQKSENPHIILRLKKDNNMVRIEVEDNGIGMDEATRKRVFEPFFTTKDVGAGTGLGLSVSYFIITTNHNGTITVESFPGKETRFIIRLPVRQQ